LCSNNINMLLDQLLEGLNSEVQSDNLRVLIQLRQLVLLQSGWLQQGETFKEWPLSRKNPTLSKPTGLLKTYLSSSPRMEELFRLWNDSDIAVQREVVRALTCILFCARSDDTIAVCRRLLRSKAGVILDTVVLALGGVNPTAAASAMNGASSSVSSSVATRVATSSSSTLAASEKLTLLSAVSSHASNVTRDLLSNHEVALRAVLKHTVTLAKRTGLTSNGINDNNGSNNNNDGSSSSSKKRPRAGTSKGSSNVSGKSSAKIHLQRSILLLQLSLVQSCPSDIKRQALDIRGFVRALLLWRTPSSTPTSKDNVVSDIMETFRGGTNTVVLTLGRDLLLTHDLSSSMKRRLFGSMVLEHLVSLSNAGHENSISLLQHLCVHPETSVFDPNDVATADHAEESNILNNTKSKAAIKTTTTKSRKSRKLSKSATTLLSVIRTLHATTNKVRQDLVCEILALYPSLIVPYSRAFPYDVENPSSTYQWLGATVLATRIQQMTQHHHSIVSSPASSLLDVLPSSIKFTKAVLGKGLQSKSRLVTSTTMTYMNSMFDVVESTSDPLPSNNTKSTQNTNTNTNDKRQKQKKMYISSETSKNARGAGRNTLAVGLQKALPDFSVLRSLLTKKYVDGEISETEEERSRSSLEFRAQLLTLMGRYLEHVPLTAQKVRYDGCTMVKKYGDLTTLLSSKTEKEVISLCDLPLLSLLSSSATAGMFQWGNFLRRIQLDTKSALKESASSGTNTTASLRVQCAAAASLFPTSLPVTPLRPLLLTCALSNQKETRTMACKVIANAVVHNGGVFAPSHAHDAAASFLPSEQDTNGGTTTMRVSTVLFLDAVLSRCVHEPLEIVMEHSNATSTWGVFVMAVVDTLRLVLERYTHANVLAGHPMDKAVADICQYVVSSLRQYGERIGKNPQILIKAKLSNDLQKLVSKIVSLKHLAPRQLDPTNINIDDMPIDEVPSILSRLCRLLLSDESVVVETKIFTKSDIVATITAAVQRVGGMNGSHSATSSNSILNNPVIQVLDGMNKMLTGDGAHEVHLAHHFALLLTSSNTSIWIESTKTYVDALLEILMNARGANKFDNPSHSISVLSPRISDAQRRHFLNNYESIDFDVWIVVELFRRHRISDTAVDVALYAKWYNVVQTKLVAALGASASSSEWVKALSDLSMPELHQLVGVESTDYLTEDTLRWLWSSSDSRPKARDLLERCLKSGSFLHIATSFEVLEAKYSTNMIAETTCFSSLLVLLRVVEGDNVPSSFVSQIIPWIRHLAKCTLETTAEATKDYKDIQNVHVPLLKRLCCLHQKYHLSDVGTIEQLSNVANVRDLFTVANNATQTSSKKKKQKKRKRLSSSSGSGISPSLPTASAVFLQFVLTDDAGSRIFGNSSTTLVLSEWGDIICEELTDILKKNKLCVTETELFWREALCDWLKMAAQSKESMVSSLLCAATVSLFKRRVSAHDVTIHDSITTSVSVLPLNLMWNLVKVLDHKPKLLEGLGGRRQMLTMVVEHSKFDETMESGSSELKDSIVKLLTCLRFEMKKKELDMMLQQQKNGSVNAGENSKGEVSSYLVSHLLRHYGATMSTTDRLLHHLIRGERKHIKRTCPMTMSMFDVQSSVWGESARLRGKDVLFRTDFSLHEKWDEWFFGKQDSDGRMTGYGLRADMLSRTVERFPTQIQEIPDMPDMSDMPSILDTKLNTTEVDSLLLYDPWFILPALRSIMLVAPVTLIDLFRQGPLGKSSKTNSSHYSHSVVALVVQATSSHSNDLRRCAYDILSRVHDILNVEVPKMNGILDHDDKVPLDLFPHRVQVSHLFRCWRNALSLLSFSSVVPLVPGIISSFVVESLRVLQRPGHPLYLQINRFLLSRVALDLEDVPMWYQCFNSGTTVAADLNKKRGNKGTGNNGVTSQHAMARTMQGKSNQRNHQNRGSNSSAAGASTRNMGNPERLWILRVLGSGLTTEEDAALCARRHVMGAMLSFHASPLADVSDRPSRTQVLRVLKSASSVPSLARLMDTAGVVPWLQRLPSGMGVVPSSSYSSGSNSKKKGSKGKASVKKTWSWDHLSIASEMLSNVLNLTEIYLKTEEKKLEDEEEAEEEAEEQEEEERVEESLNVHSLRLSSLLYALVDLFRRGQNVYESSSFSSGLSHLSVLTRMIWRVYTCSMKIRARYNAVRKLKNEDQMKAQENKKEKEKKEKNDDRSMSISMQIELDEVREDDMGDEMFNAPPVHIGLTLHDIWFAAEHELACAVDLMTSLRCMDAAHLPPSSRIKEVNAWRDTVISCIDRLTLDLGSSSVTTGNQGGEEWTATTVRFTYWCFRSMGASDIMREIIHGLCSSAQSSLHSLHRAALRRGVSGASSSSAAVNAVNSANANANVLDATHALNVLQVAGRGEGNWTRALPSLRAPAAGAENAVEVVDCRLVAALCLCGGDDIAVQRVLASVHRVWPESKVAQAVLTGSGSSEKKSAKKSKKSKKKRKRDRDEEEANAHATLSFGKKKKK
jgi:hypothetical protein